MSHKHRAYGFTLAELLIALALLGLIAAFTIPKILNSNTQQKQQAQRLNTQQVIQQALQMANTSIGLLPVSDGSGQVLKNYLKTLQYDTPAMSAVPAACSSLTVQGVPVVQLGDSHAVLENGTEVYGLKQDWNTGLQDAQGNAVDAVCVITH